jgi:hypothetical protein
LKGRADCRGEMRLGHPEQGTAFADTHRDVAVDNRP